MRRILLTVGTTIAVSVATFLPVGTGAVATAAVAPEPLAVWAGDGDSAYIQRWAVQDPTYNGQQGKSAQLAADLACMAVPTGKLATVAKKAQGLKGGARKPVPNQPRPDDPELKRKLEALMAACEDGLGHALAAIGPSKAWRDAKADGVCVRLDFFQVGFLVWNYHTAPDADSRYCRPGPSVGTPRPDDSVATPRVRNQAPRPTFTYQRRAGAGNLVALNSAGSYDPDGRIVAWRWHTGGGTTLSTAANPTIKLGAVTAKHITLSVTDNLGAVSSLSRMLYLGNRAPGITWVSPGNNSLVGSNRPTLNAGTYDDDGDRLQFSYRVTGPQVSLDSGWVGGAWTVPPHKLDPGTAYSWTVTVRDPRGARATRTSVFRVAMLPTANDIVSTSTGTGYWQVASDGGVFSYGTAQFHGSLPGVNVKVNNILGLARTPTDGGYWLVGRDGGVFSFGDAQFHGSLPGQNIRVDNIVGMAPTKDGKGYWLVGSDGGVFSFGSAQFYGSMGGKHLNGPVEAMAVTASGNGYWLVARDGGVFSFGDAPFHGGMGGHHLNSPMVDIDTSPDGGGYYLTAEDGGVFTYGNARFHGSMGGKPLNGRVTGMGVTADGGGYWLSACDGGVFAFGNAPFAGSRPVYKCRGVG